MAFVDVLISTVRASKPKEDGSVTHWTVVQGVMHLPEGRQEMFVDSIFPGKDVNGRPNPAKEIPPGRYQLIPNISIDYKTREPGVRGFTYQPAK